MEVRMRSRFTLLLLLFASLLATSILIGGCGRNAPSAPKTSATEVTTSVALPSRPIPADAPELAGTIAAQNRATPGLLGIQGVLGTGTSADAAGKPVIVIYAERPGIGGLPSVIEGHGTRVLVTGKVVRYVKPGGGTLQMGTSTGNDNECASGTLACVVVRSGTDYFLSNNHVFARENDASIGERIDAPGRYDGHPVCAQTPQCGTLSQFQTISFSNNNTVDCAIARPISGLNYTNAEAGGYTPVS